jgi:hypothetical protein
MNAYSLLGLTGLLVRVIFYPESGALLVIGVGLFILGIVDMFYKVGKSIALARAMQVDSYAQRTNLQRTIYEEGK